MKYVKSGLLNPAIKSLTCLLLILFLGACGGQQVKSSSKQADKPEELLATLEFLPVPVKGDDGNYLPYEAVANPYLTRGRIKKNSVEIFIEARKAYKSEEYDKAEKLLHELTKADDSISGPWVMLGDIALQRGNRTLAGTHFEQALKINRDNINAWLRLAYVQRLQGEYIAAQNTYVGALQVWRDCPEAHLNLAVLYDLYLNLPIRAQKHMEAYLYLNNEQDQRAVGWLNELQARTGVALSLPLKRSAHDQSSPDKSTPDKSNADQGLMVAK